MMEYKTNERIFTVLHEGEWKYVVYKETDGQCRYYREFAYPQNEIKWIFGMLLAVHFTSLKQAKKVAQAHAAKFVSEM